VRVIGWGTSGPLEKYKMRMRRIVICAVSGCTIFFHIASQTARFKKKVLVNTKCVLWVLLQYWN